MVTDVPVSIPDRRTAVFDLLHAISQKHDLHGWIEDCLVRVFKRYSPCENPFRMIVASLDVSEASGQARARIYPTDLQGVMPCPYICLSGTGVSLSKPPYIRWQMPPGSTDLIARLRLPTEPSASTARK